MKRLLVFLSILVLGLSSCSKENLSKGLYFADTKDGMLYLELQSGEDCVMFFQGGNKENCTYKISKGEIDLLGHASIKIDGRTRSWWFGGNLGKGVISGDSFKIQSQRMFTSDLEYYYLTFYKH